MSDGGPRGDPEGIAPGGAALRVRILGPFEIEGADLRDLRSRKARTILKLLALGRGRPVRVDRLVDGLWPEGGEPSQPEREVAVNVSRARRVVGPARITRSDEGYRLIVDWLDLDHLERLAEEARRRHSLGDHAATRTLATAALALVRGPLLADEVDLDWLATERAAAARAIAELRGLAGAAALGAGEWGEAARWAELALDDDPYDEPAARVLLTARLRAGRPGSALAAYAELRVRLADDLGASPSAETEALHRELLVATGDPEVAPRVALASALAPSGSVPGSATHVPGRDAQIAVLATAAAEVTTHRRLRVVLVEGEAGAGKTHLLDAFARHTVEAGGVVLAGRCDELGRALPLQPLADALAAHLHLVGDDLGADELLGTDRDLLAPLLGLGPQPPRPSVPAPAMSTEAMQALVFAALLRVVVGMAGQGATVLVIDDLHLAGPSTIAWLRFAIRRGAQTPLLVVAARRPGEGPTLAEARRLELEPLDVAAATEIVGPARAALLVERSGGNPLLMIELADHPADALPGSIRELVAAQVARAGPQVALTMRTAAILGPEIDLDLLAEVSELSPLELLGNLEVAAERRLLAERGSRFEFRHALIRDALLAETSAARQALVHRQAAHVLAPRPDADPLRLAHHARLAGDGPVAAEALARAAALASGRHDLAEAEALLSQAIELHDTAEIRLARGHLRVARTDFHGGEADAEVAIAAGRTAEGLALRAWIARHRHEMAGAIRLGRQGAAVATDPTTRASCLLAMALAERGLGHLAEAERRLAEASAVGAPVDLGLPGWLGVVRVHQGRPEEALDQLEPAVGAEVDIIHGFWVEHVLQMAAHAHALTGRPDRALTLVDRMTAEMARRGSTVRYGGADDNYRAWILGNLGQPQAVELTESARQRARMPEIEAQAWLDDAARRSDQGDPDGARRSLGAAEAISAGQLFAHRWRCQARAQWLGGRLALTTGDPEGAVALADALVDQSQARGERRYASLGQLLAARGRHRLDPSQPPDLEALEVELDRLGQVAGLEAWWITAEVAAEFDQPRWWALAERRVAELATNCGELADPFLAHAGGRLDRLRVSGPGP